MASRAETTRSGREDAVGDCNLRLQLPRSCSGVSLGLLCGYCNRWMKGLPRENQVKLTVSVPPSLHVLLRSWAQCEGRELTSVVLQCVELSVRQLKSSGSIPAGAVRNYELACEERLASSGLGGVG